MSNYVIFTDPGCDFSYEDSQKLNVNVFPYIINIGDKSYITTLAWDNFSEKELFSMVKKQAPSFSRPPLGDWFNMVEDIFKKELDILYVGMSQKLTGSINSLSVIYKNLMEKYPDRRLIMIDTLTVSKPLAYYVTIAAENLKRGLSLEENESHIKSILNTAKLYIIPKKALLFKITNRGDASSLGNLNKLTILKMTDDGQLIPDQSFKSENKIYEMISNQRGDIRISFTNDFKKRKAESIIKKFRDRDISYGDVSHSIGCNPFTDTTCGPETVVFTLIKK